ncbi:MAG: amylosucrase, partial [Oscillospiraceae bacterium]|nr:amylosucrase [Oscillospiraceae bacterium]
GTTASLCGLEGADTETAIRKITMLHAMMLFQSGIPVLYSGDEIGQLNDWTYKADPNKVQDSRYLHRGKMPWDLAEKISDPTSVQSQIFRGLDKLERVRRENKAFSSQADFWTFNTGSDQVLGLGRFYDGEVLLGLFNFGEQDISCTLPSGTFTDLMHGMVMDRGATVSAFGFVCLKEN